MGATSDDDGTPVATLECLAECKQLFSKLLTRQAHIFKTRRRTNILTDREVRKAFDVLLEGKRPSWWSIALSHTLEVVGGGVVAYGWHFGKDHSEFGFAAWTMIFSGVALFILGFVVREFLARN